MSKQTGNKTGRDKKAQATAAGTTEFSALQVRTRKANTTFFRAGLRFTHEAVTLPCTDLTDEQIAALEGEPKLDVQWCHADAVQTNDDNQAGANGEAVTGADPAAITGAAVNTTEQAG